MGSHSFSRAEKGNKIDPLSRRVLVRRLGHLSKESPLRKDEAEAVFELYMGGYAEI